MRSRPDGTSGVLCAILLSMLSAGNEMSRVVSVLVAVALVLCAAGCSGDSSSTRAEARSSTSIASTLRNGDRYVALGTSIASGYGISVQSTACGRSNRNYPNLIAARFDLKLVDVTCGSATIPNVLETPERTVPPQIKALTPDTRLVTISVGGNDITYNGPAIACGDPKTVCTAPAAFAANVISTRSALKTLVNKLKAAAPSATIVFVTDPREVPAHKNCVALSYTNSEAAVVRSMGDTLETMLVDVVKPTGVLFVDPYVAPGDHTGCAPVADRWTAGHTPDDGFAYHPTALGHQVMADMVTKALGG